MTKTVKDFYKEKGITRYTLILPQLHKIKIETIAKTYKISQGAVIEVLLDNMDVEKLTSAFEAKNEDKGSRKGSKRQIIEKMKDLKPEQLAEIAAHIAKITASTVGSL